MLTPEISVQIDNYFNNLKNQWSVSSISLQLDKSKLNNAFQFMIESLDKLIVFVEPLIQSGIEKKSVVINVIEKLFVHVVIKSLPVWMLPFSGMITDIIVIIFSVLIDYFVSKYNNGVWKV